jgi:hypothetical protein
MKQDLAIVFVLEALEHAQGTARVYRVAADCTADRERRRRFQTAASAVARDASVLEQLCAALGVNVDHPTAAREIVKDANLALEKQIVSASAEADDVTAEAVALQCAAAADTRSLANVEVLARIAPQLPEAASSVWAAASAPFEEGVRERLTYARLAWEQLLLRRLDVDAVESTAATGTRASTTGAAEAAG